MAFIKNAFFGNDLEAFGQQIGLDAAMGFDHADDGIDTVQAPLASLGEHLVGLADAGRRAEKNLQPAAAFLARFGQKCFRRRTFVGTLGHPGTIAYLMGVCMASSARLSFSTLTCG